MNLRGVPEESRDNIGFLIIRRPLQRGKIKNITLFGNNHLTAGVLTHAEVPFDPEEVLTRMELP